MRNYFESKIKGTKASLGSVHIESQSKTRLALRGFFYVDCPSDVTEDDVQDALSALASCLAEKSYQNKQSLPFEVLTRLDEKLQVLSEKVDALAKPAAKDA